VWTAIHVMLFGYTLAQLGENQRRVAAYDQVSMLVVLASLVASLQLTTLWLDDILVTSAVCGLLAGVAGTAYVEIQREVTADRLSVWVRMPFALLVAWSATMAVASAEGAIASAGCTSAGPAAVLVSVLGGVAVYLGLVYRDVVVPATVAALVLATWAANRLAPPVASCALVVGSICATTAVMIGTRRSWRPMLR
jgi:hypothetical protein